MMKGKTKISRRITAAILTIVMVVGMFTGIVPGTGNVAKAIADATESSFTVNNDGTLSISETAAAKAIGNLDNAHMVLIGTKGGTISNLPTGSGIITKSSADNNAAMVRYTSAQTKNTIITMLQTIKFSDTTTQIHIDVTYGNTSASMESVDNFGVLNADGEAHVYKLIDHGSNISWIAAFDATVKATDRLGGLKGYLATVTTSEEANLVKAFYNSSENGTWIAGTSLKYSTDTNSNYASAGKVTPTNYNTTAASYASSQKISATVGSYYCPFGSSSVTAGTYYNYYYWACGPEQGKTVDTSLWANGEPNNSDSTRGGETCIVSPWSGNAEFNDFSPFNTVSKYFLEFSAYNNGIADGGAYHSVTIYKVAFDKNGATGGTEPAPREKFKGIPVKIPGNSGGLVKSNDTWFAGWNKAEDGSGENYISGDKYETDEAVKLYAYWTKYGYNRQYDPKPATGIVYDGSPHLLLKDTDEALGVWRVNKPTDANESNFTYWYSRSKESDFVSGSIEPDGAHTDNVGYKGSVNTECSPIYEVNAGTYTIYWNWDCNNSYEGGVNFDAAGHTSSLEVTIAPKEFTDINSTVTQKAGESLVYTGKANPPTIEVKDVDINTELIENTDYTVEYEGTGTTEYTKSTTAPTMVGSYIAIITGKGNYIGTKELPFTIAKVAPDVTAPTDKKSVYSGSEQELVNEAKTDNGTIYYALGKDSKTAPDFDGTSASEDKIWGTDVPKATEVGTYNVWYKVLGNEGYLDTDAMCVKASILKKIVKIEGVTASDYTGVYDGVSHTITVTSDDKDVKVTYSDKENGTYSETNPAYTDAGTYTVYYKAEKEDAITVTGSKTITISKKELTVSAKDQTVSFGNDLSQKASKYVLGALASGDTADVLLTADLSTYKIVPSITVKNGDKDVTANYEIKATEGIISIKQVPMIKVTATANGIKVAWDKVKGVNGYKIYVGYCGSEKAKLIGMTKGNKIKKKTINKLGGKIIKKNKPVKVRIVAYKKIKGKNVAVQSSIMAHVMGIEHKKFSNAKSVTVSKKTYTLKAGKSASIKASVKVADSNKEQLSEGHAAEIRYASSDNSVATVNSKGVIEAKATGNCTIYVYAVNGAKKKIKVIVK
ncbi:MAG: Ig-like domain-containing protein [Lachnospiraceae bacterium]|nr:Ig-like domain-containing protein [Lachnospiraceae bacterium]